jgi:N-methylhydantoinase A
MPIWRALRAVTSERGVIRAIRVSAMGGNGGVHAANLAESLNVGRIVVPPVAGLLARWVCCLPMSSISS